MNRFFSKLDLRDIKINPEGSHFPPDGDDENEHVETQTEDVTEAPYEDVATATEPADVDDEETSAFSDTVSYESATAVEEVVPASQNGHARPESVSAAYESGDEVLKVSARSRPSAVAGAIAGVVREYGRAEVQAIGAGATNQAVKAAAIARDYLSETGIDAVCLPAFIDVIIENEDRTAIRLVIEAR